MKERKQFTKEFKEGAVRLVTEQGRTIGDAAQSLGISPWTMSRWVKTAKAEGSEAEIVVRSLKFDGSLHREWRARLVRRDDPLLVLEGIFAEEVRHPLLGIIAHGTVSTEYYWTDRWYSVFRFKEPTGEHRNFYCNINRPPAFDGRFLTFIDLDIDVLVAPDFTTSVLDEDEFVAHAARYGYPADVCVRVRASLAELLRLIDERGFPFGGRS